MASLSRWLYRLRTPRIDLRQLGASLGHPETILCLGNGPSSESQELDSMSWDTMFRVNARWMGLGRREDPQVIFLAREADDYRKLLDAVAGGRLAPPAIFVRGRKGVRWARRAGFRQVRDTERIDCWITREDHRERSHVAGRRYTATNGMIMLAVAAALQPRRLIVGGIDLYRHPGGDYAGSDGKAKMLETWNEHGRHGPQLEEMLCRRTLLQEYRGELVAVGAPLRELLTS